MTSFSLVDEEEMCGRATQTHRNKDKEEVVAAEKEKDEGKKSKTNMQSDTKMPLIATRNIRLCQLRKSSNGKKEFFFSLEYISCLKKFSVPTNEITRN